MAENELYKMSKRSFVKNSGKLGAFSLSGIPYTSLSRVFGENSNTESSRRMAEGNGIITNIWLDRSMFYTFKEYGLKYIFVDIGDVDKKTGKITTPRNQIEAFAKDISSFQKESNYKFTVLPWNVVIPEEGYQFGSPDFRKNYADEYVHLVKELGFDGMLVDIEAIPDELKSEYLKMLRNWRDELPEGSILSLYSGSIIDDDVKGNVWNWPESFLGEVVENGADLISIPTYDTDSGNEEEYRAYLQDKLRRLSRRKKGTFRFPIPTHKPAPELAGYALDEYLKAKKKYCNFQISGVDLFATWTIKDENWKELEEFLKTQESPSYRVDMALKNIACMLGLND